MAHGPELEPGHDHPHDHLDTHGPGITRTLPGLGQEGGPAPLPQEIASEVLNARLSESTRAPKGAAPFGGMGGMVGGPGGGPQDAAVIQHTVMTSGGFAQLNSSQRLGLQTAFAGTDPKSLRTQGMLGMLARDPSFAQATPERQSRALQQVLQNAAAPAAGGLMGGGMGGGMGGMGGGMGSAKPAPSVDQTLRTLRGTEGWAKLSGDERGRIETRVRKPGQQGELARHMFSNQSKDPGFQLMDGAGQAQRLNQGRQMLSVSTPQMTQEGLQTQLQASPGFKGLTEAERSRLTAPPKTPESMMVRSAASTLLQTPEWKRAGAEAQSGALRQVLAQKADGPPPPSTLLSRKVANSPGWSHLSTAEQTEIKQRITQPGEVGQQQRRSLDAALNNPRQALRNPKEQAQGLRDYLSATHLGAGQDPTTTLPQDALQQVQSLPGYGGMDGASKQRFNALLKGPTNGLSYRARREVERLTASVEADTRAVQTNELKRFLSEGSHVPDHSSVLADPGASAHATLGASRSLGKWNFQGTEVPASTRQIEVGGQSIVLVYPDGLATKDAQGKLPQPKEVAQALARLPASQLSKIKSVTLSPVENPSNSYWSKKYDISNFKSAATAGPDGRVTIYPSSWTVDALSGTLRHELGHVLDPTLGAGGADREAATTKWRAAQTQDLTYSSTYAQASVAEDVAETYGLYIATRGTPAHDELRALFPNRFAILDARAPD